MIAALLNLDLPFIWLNLQNQFPRIHDAWSEKKKRFYALLLYLLHIQHRARDDFDYSHIQVITFSFVTAFAKKYEPNFHFILMFDATAFIFFTFDEFFCFFSLHQLQINFVVDTFWSVWTSIQATNQKEELTDLYTCMYFSSFGLLLSLACTHTRTRYLCFAIFFLMSTANHVYGLRSHRHTQTNAYAYKWTWTSEFNGKNVWTPCRMLCACV